MELQSIYAELKRSMPSMANSRANELAGKIRAGILRWHKQELVFEKRKWADDAEKKQAKKAEAEAKSGSLADDRINYYRENPMTPEEEAKTLRAMLHAGISKGEIPAPLLDKLDKIIGINSGEDESIEVVEFRDAFPDLAEAIAVCTKPRPVTE